MSNIVIFFIKVYQRIFSPDQGLFSFFFTQPVCRHFPTCSEYTILMIRKYGVFYGLSLGLWRVLKCNPLSSSNYKTN